MQTLTWLHQCYYCQKPIMGGRPTLLFSHNESLFIGVSHSMCCFTKMEFSHFQMCPPTRLFCDQVSFLTYYFPMLDNLPGSRDNPKSQLRWSLVRILREYPESMKKPLTTLNASVQEHSKLGYKLYEGDLEMDFLKFLGQVQRLVREKSVDVEADFRKSHQSR